MPRIEKNSELYICRYAIGPDSKPRIGLVLDKGDGLRKDVVIGDLSERLAERLQVRTVSDLGELNDPVTVVKKLARTTKALSADILANVHFLPCIDNQEVEAAGVTYMTSIDARTDESGTDIYKAVGRNKRPEIFGKSHPRKVIGPGAPLAIRHDSKWNVPEGEFTLVFNSQGQLLGVTAGNDMSSRDIEGDNPLYLPQAKVYNQSCGIGAFMRIGTSLDQLKEEAVIKLEILRNGEPLITPLEGRVSDIQRTFQELRDYLFNSRTFESGVALLTGTNTVPAMKHVLSGSGYEGIDVPGREGKQFSLEDGDLVKITISGVCPLDNPIVRLPNMSEGLPPLDFPSVTHSS